MFNPFKYFQHHKYVMGALVVAVVLLTAVFSRLANKNISSSTPQPLSKVVLAAAKDYMKDRGTVSANGSVESLEQAELRSQASGPVTRINAQIGSKVLSGQVLVALQNADVSAQLAQAEATLKAQAARLDEMKSGARTEEVRVVEAQVATAKQALEDTRAQQDVLVANALTSLLNSGLAAIPATGNNGSVNPTVTGTYSSTQQGSYQISIYSTGDGQRFQFGGMESGGGLVSTVPVALGTRGLFIQFSSTNIPSGNTWTVSIPNTQSAGYIAASNAYKSAVEGRDAAINAATNALNSAQRALDLKNAGSSSQQIQVQEAAVEQAQASVRAIAAQLEKTIIRSPISGTVSVLSVKYGELVSPGQLVASVVNKGGLQVKAYLSDYDMPYVAEGAEAQINDSIKGKVVRVSPSINPNTKNVEVNVAVDSPETSGLVVGQNASVKIAAKQSSGGEGPVFLLPLQAVKVFPGGASVFIVKDDSTLEERPVTLGNISGETVEVTQGLNPEMQIVSTVYELKAGQKVSVENN